MQNSGIREVQYDLPEMQSGARTVANAWARVPRTLSPQEKQACRENADLREGLNIVDGKVVYKGVAEAWGMPYTPVEEVL